MNFFVYLTKCWLKGGVEGSNQFCFFQEREVRTIECEPRFWFAMSSNPPMLYCIQWVESELPSYKTLQF